MLSEARAILESGDYTCVIIGDSYKFTSDLRGVKPLVRLCEKGETPQGLFAADKVVGMATAYLYVLLKVQALYARVMSESAIEVLQKYGIEVCYDTKVSNIINRKGDGICPFEQAVMEIENPKIAYKAIIDKMREMNISIWE